MQSIEFEELDKMFETGFNEAVKHILSFLKGELSEDELNVLLKHLDLKTGKDIKQFISEHFLPKSKVKEMMKKITEDFLNFPFSKPTGEGKFTFLYCQNCKSENYICKGCLLKHMETILKDLDL